MIDLYRRSNVCLYRADSRLLLPVHMGRADLILTDPPYGIDYHGKGHRLIRGDGRLDCDRGNETILDWSIPLMVAKLRPGGRLLIWTSEKVLDHWVEALERSGVPVRAQIVWDKGNAWFDRRAKEVLLVAGGADDCSDATWVFPTVRDKELRADHPTPKPPELMERALREFSNRGDLVIDPFAGCSPIGVAAVRVGDVRYVGAELDRQYYQSAVMRLDRAVVAREAVERVLAELGQNPGLALAA
jgi:DNA modification methylase